MKSSWIYFSLFGLFTVAGLFTSTISVPFVAVIGTVLISLSFIIRPAFKKETLKRGLLETVDNCSKQITQCNPDDKVETCEKLCYGVTNGSPTDKIYECTKLNGSASKLAHEDSLRYACVQKQGQNEYTNSSQVICPVETGYNFLAGRQTRKREGNSNTVITGWDCICAYPEWFGVTTKHNQILTRCKMPNPGVCMGPLHIKESLDLAPRCNSNQILLTSGQEHSSENIVVDDTEPPKPWIQSPFSGFYICPPGNCYTVDDKNEPYRFFCNEPDSPDTAFYNNPRPGQLPNFNQCLCATNYRRYIDRNGLPICIPASVDEDILLDIHSVGSPYGNTDGTKDSRGSGSCSVSCSGGSLCKCPQENEVCLDGACIDLYAECSTSTPNGLCPMDQTCVRGLCQSRLS